MDGVEFDIEKRRLMTLKEVARLFNVSERTVWANTSPRGPIPVIHIGNSIRYSPDEIQDWIKRQIVKSKDRKLSA